MKKWMILVGCLYTLSSWSASVEITDAWVRFMPKSAPATGVFMEIKNNGGEDLKVVKAESSWAKVVELHDHILENGVYKMRPIPEINLKKGEKALLKPGSLHVMLIGLTKELVVGEQVDVQLTLSNNEKVSVKASVREMQGMGKGSGMGRNKK